MTKCHCLNTALHKLYQISLSLSLSLFVLRPIFQVTYHTAAHDVLRLTVDTYEGSGQLEKTAGTLSQRLAQQRPAGCRRYDAIPLSLYIRSISH